MTSDFRWVQVYIENACDKHPHTLVLRATFKDNFEIYDPQQQKIIISFDDLREAGFWLNEDEYERVLGRIPSDISDIDNDGYFNELTQRAIEIREKYVEYNRNQNQKQWTKEDYMMGFIGDVGDLAKLVMAHQNIRNIPDKEAKLAHELSDCLWSIMVLAKMYDIDLESAFLDTMRDLEKFLNESKNGSE